jgi:hypothetical protein
MLDKNRLNFLVQVLTFEKIVQHLVTAVLFLEILPGFVPDIGGYIFFSNQVMFILNLIVTFCFAVALLYIRRGRLQGYRLNTWLCWFDIVAEFAFHGIGYITISVIICAFLLILIYFYRK